MLRSQFQARTRRRGIVLLLILGMLGLLALIGVTFASYSGQSQIAARNFSRAFMKPETESLFDFALNQLINDTDNPMSAIRGHSLKRDMYGNDATNNGAIDRLPGNTPLTFRSIVPLVAGDAAVVETNIPANVAIPGLYGRDITRWTLRIGSWNDPGPNPAPNFPNDDVFYVAQTFEILAVGTSNNYVSLTLSPPDLNTPRLAQPTHALLPNPVTSFILDGRFRNSFNGPGMASLAQFANFRFNGGLLTGNPLVWTKGTPDYVYDGTDNNLGLKSGSSIGMDEDYDAPDLENWFLALQSADGQVMIPSFHRPSIVSSMPIQAAGNYSDWTVPAPDAAMSNAIKAKSISANSRILRPRAVDHPAAGTGTFPNLIPDRTDSPAINPHWGKITYDIDNDNDGVTDSVWLDLGYPVQKDPTTNKLYKPLFAFMVLGLNGRMPLNTVGNIQGRGVAQNAPGTAYNLNQPTFDHASSSGYSPSEINPKFALQNAAPVKTDDSIYVGPSPPIIPMLGYLPGYSQADNAGEWISVTQLRNLLTGTRKPGTTQKPNGDNNFVVTGIDSSGNPIPVAMGNNLFDQFDNFTPGTATVPPYVTRKSDAVLGRYGEAGGIATTINGPPTASGLAEHNPRLQSFSNSSRPGRSTFPLDVENDDFTSLDPSQEGVNTVDVSSSLLLPVERFQRFVTPFDIDGNGRLYAHGWVPATTAAALLSNNPTQLFGSGVTPFGLGADDRGRVMFYRHYRPPGLPDGFALTGPAPYPSLDPHINKLHGYNAIRNPNFDAASAPLDADPTSGGAMPFDVSGTNPNFNILAANTVVPSYNTSPLTISSTAMALANPSATVFTAYSWASPAWNAATEFNPYAPDQSDAPFGFQDLEYLYRQRDIDAPSLTSRLADLAPISFDKSPDAEMRRRMFSIDVAEPNQFIWSHDNPGFFSADNRINNSRFGENVQDSIGRFHMPTASIEQLNLRLNSLVGAPVRSLTPPTTPPYAGQAANLRPYFLDPIPNTVTLNVPSIAMPSLAHRGRKINLNMPLPISDDPNEPVRQKWCQDTYNLLKMVLPPKALDTPQELAALSQYVVNIVDFRDTDATMTRFVNADLYLQDPSATAPATVSFYEGTVANTKPLVQFGMEYQPVAITEALAYSFFSQNGSSSAQPRLFVEVMNLLTDAKDDSSSSDLTLTNWDIVLTDEGNRTNPTTNLNLAIPSPITGEPFESAPNTLHNFVLSSVAANPPTVQAISKAPTRNPSAPPGNRLIIGTPIAGGTDGGSNQPAVNTVGRGVPIDMAASRLGQYLTDTNNVYTTPNNGGSFRYFWIYLRRPASLQLPVGPTNPLVTVDSIRVPYFEATSTYTTDAMGQPQKDANSGVKVQSVKRRQPYRGGHWFDAAIYPRTALGYSEQVIPTTGSANPNPPTAFHGISSAASSTVAITETIYHSFGTGGSGTEDRDHFPVFDRDVTSVVDLLLVPAAAPGLFTKQFVEHSYNGSAHTVPHDNMRTPTDGYRNPGNAGRYSPAFTNDAAGNVYTPRAFPYLPDQFYYSAKSETFTLPAPPTGFSPVTGGWTDGGWYKMFDFLDVPSPYLGTIGPVTEGENYDWSRQDLKHGLLNLNLIIDEEVFMGLLDDPRLSLAELDNSLFDPGFRIGDAAGFNSTGLPLIVTEANPLTGGVMVDDPTVPDPHPVGFYPMHGWYSLKTTPAQVVGDPGVAVSRGFWLYNAASPPASQAKMKAAFADFLKLRHGGSNFLFSSGSGAVGNDGVSTYLDGSTVPPTTRYMSFPVERPFRSFSYPDINYTVMRPATLPRVEPPLPITNAGKWTENYSIAAVPPDAFTFPTAQTPFPITDIPVTAALAGTIPATPLAPYIGDPGVRNPLIAWTNVFASSDPTTPMAVNPIPARRLFQVADYYNDFAMTPTPYSNASVFGNTSINTIFVLPLTDISANLFTRDGVSAIDTPPRVTYGSATDIPGTTLDRRAHPAFRTEILRKVVNQTTVRTHQYAVWITIGFFEVTKQGDPATLTPDQFGPEIGKTTGDEVRARAFFVVDRTKATGFGSALYPGDYNECVTYRRTIEQ